MTLRLLLVRHGLSSFNLEKRIQGRTNLSTLTREGELQALETGKSLSGLSITSLYSSPLQRAYSSSEKIIEGLNQKVIPIIEEGLLEVDLEPWCGMTSEEVKSLFPKEYKAWKYKPKELILKRQNGISYKPIEELINQAKKLLDKIINNHSPEKDSNIIVVGHNVILRCLIMLLLNQSDDNVRRIKLNNSSISIFNISQNKDKYKVQIESLNNITHLNPPIPKKGNSARIILVRHGETNWNKEGRFQGQIDIPLNSNGIKQASAVSEFLKTIEINKAFSSSMSRPKQTAIQILKHHPNIAIEEKEELIEIGHGLWEGKLESEIKNNWKELLNLWKDSPQKVQMPEGENINQVWERSVKCWNQICNNINSGDTAIVVAHDAVNKTILCHILGLSPNEIWIVKQGNGGISIIDLEKDPNISETITCLNITSHLGGVLDNTAAGAL